MCVECMEAHFRPKKLWEFMANQKYILFFDMKTLYYEVKSLNNAIKCPNYEIEIWINEIKSHNYKTYDIKSQNCEIKSKNYEINRVMR